MVVLRLVLGSDIIVLQMHGKAGIVVQQLQRGPCLGRISSAVDLIGERPLNHARTVCAGRSLERTAVDGPGIAVLTLLDTLTERNTSIAAGKRHVLDLGSVGRRDLNKDAFT